MEDICIQRGELQVQEADIDGALVLKGYGQHNIAACQQGAK